MIRIIKLIIWILIISGAIFGWKYYSYTQKTLCSNVKSTHFEVPKGWVYANVLEELSGEDFWSKVYLKLHTPDTPLQAWKYNLQCGTPKEIIESLKTPMNETDEFITFLEGWNIYDIDQTLSSKWLIESGDFVNYVTTCEGFCEQKTDFAFIADAESLEGFLYPDTYAINPNNFTIWELVKKMLSRFQEKVINSGIISDMGSIEILDTLTMASIVQKEANKRDNPEEIALIAGILKKRLKEGWQIGADATICYPYKIATQDCTPAKVLEYLYEKNDYNTRQMVGLPKWPIANPEAEVIEATLNSRDSKYYYYLHDNSGQIHYGVSGADHEANKNRYLR